MELRRLLNSVNEEDAIGNSARRTALRGLHVALKIPYIYDYTAELCRQVELRSCHNIKNVHVHGKYRGADKSLARPEMKQSTTTEDFDFHISYL